MAEAVAQPQSIQRQRTIILVLLLALTAASWIVLIWQAGEMDGNMSLTMGMGAPLFIALWVVMMAAMMFPASASMVLMFSKIQAGKPQRGINAIPTWVFLAGYMAVWSAAGVVAYGGALAGDELADRWAFAGDNAYIFAAGLLVAAGVYQVTPLKDVCLQKCRTPLSFVMNSWRDGYDGALRMGIDHGVYCLGCCWLLFVILFPLGMMNIAILALITLFIFVEKSTPFGHQAAKLAAVGLVAYGAVVLFSPGALPMTMDHDMSAMSGMSGMADSETPAIEDMGAGASMPE